jgi:hypothetical protein
MIVRDRGDRLQLITQPDHAAAARGIMEGCPLVERRERRGALLHAIEEHDNGWREVDAEPIVDPATGGVFDFVSIPVPIRQAIWPRAVARLADHPWAAALVAQHAITVYERFRTDPGWTAFFREMAVTRDAMEAAAGLTRADLVDDYRFLRLADLISLAFCTEAPGEQQFGDWTIRRAGAHVAVLPDVFGGATVRFEVRATEIDCRRYASDAELRAAVASGRTLRLPGTVGGLSAPR